MTKGFGAKTGRSPAEARAASARGASALGARSLGAFAAGAAASGAVAIGALAIRSLVVKRAKVEHLRIENLEVGRLRVRELVTDEARPPHPFEDLEGHRYMNLTTFRKNGEAVPTPVWFALVDGRLYATTAPNSGKMKRIRNGPRVLLAPSNFRGKPLGESVEGLARILDDGEAPENAGVAFGEKYRLGLSLFRVFGRTEVGELTLEVRPADAGAPRGALASTS